MDAPHLLARGLHRELLLDCQSTQAPGEIGNQQAHRSPFFYLPEIKGSAADIGDRGA